MKTLVVLLSLFASSAIAQPMQMAFTGNLSNSGAPTTGPHDFTFTLYDAATQGTSTWTETQTALNVNEGVVITTLGANTALTLAVLNGDPRYLEVTVDGTVLSPRLAVTSVPYAIRALAANTAATLGTLMPSDVQKRVAGTCPSGSSVQNIDANGGVACTTDLDTGVNAVTAGAGVTASIATRTLSVAANFGSTAGTTAQGDHGHTLGCGYRTVTAVGPNSVSSACAAGEQLVGGGCNSDGTLSDSYPFQSCPPAMFCSCTAGTRCSMDSWQCVKAGGTSLTAYAVCCDTPLRGNVP
jgi:hypothetical protein